GGGKGAGLGAGGARQPEAHRWRGEFGGARRCGVGALDRLPRDGDEWHGAAAEVALSAGRLGDVEALMLILARLRARPLDLDASPSRVIAWTRTAGQMILAGPRETAEEVFAQIERVAGAVTDPTVAGR